MTPLPLSQAQFFLRRLALAMAQPSVRHWILMPAFVWFVGGLFLDGWAHNHGRVDNTFFTPWHAVFYSGYLAVALALGLLVWSSWMRGEQWQSALALPYRIAILAAPGFGMAGVADLWWHTNYGFEAGITLLLSPPHLALAGSMVFICLVPARTDDVTRTPRMRIPALLSVLSAWSIASFILQFNHPFGIVWPEQTRIGETGVTVGMVGIIFHFVLTGLVGGWLLIKRFAPGGLTVVVVCNALLIALMGDHYRFAVGVGIAALLTEGLDAVLARNEITIAQRVLVRAGTLATLCAVSYFAVIAATGVLIWPLSVCSAVCLVCGVSATAAQNVFGQQDSSHL